jgi:hypothetical protein
MTVDLQTILNRATSGRSLDKSRMFRPSWFYSMIKDPFWVWCEYHAPWVERVDETTLFDRHRVQMGNEWEDRYVASNFPTAHVIKSQWGEDALRETLIAMLQGEAAISGGTLWLPGEEVYGKVDTIHHSQHTFISHALSEGCTLDEVQDALLSGPRIRIASQVCHK